ncbi:MAG: nitroreductase family protein [Chloroflexi bacterium]|nr:nitroreductase family protein [Chloroflexota bacterium]MCC6892943.1 nitroreductase family protein [Anaerolineae bacterium]
MTAYDVIRAKRAIRKFTDQPLPDEAIHTILNAGRLAQSSKNLQERTFIAIRDRETLQAVSTCGEWAGHLAGAALGIAILTPDPNSKFQLMFDAGQSAAYMQLAAWELGIGSCLASIYDGEKARGILGFPPEWHLRIAISFGYPQPEALEPRPAKPEGRKDFDDLVKWDRWE